MIYKFNLTNIFEIPSIQKIEINIGFDVNSSIKKISPLFLLVNLITKQSAVSTISKKNKVIVKIKKGSFTGCKTTLRGDKLFLFLEYLFTLYLPLNKDFKGFKIKDTRNATLTIKLKNIFNFIELRNELIRFKNIKGMDVTIFTKTQNLTQKKAILNSFKENLFI